jgi:hypothetical protein
MKNSEKHFADMAEHIERLEDKVNSYHEVMAHIYCTIGQLIFEANRNNLSIKLYGDSSVDENHLKSVLSKKYQDLRPETLELLFRALKFYIGTFIKVGRLREKGMNPVFINIDVLKEISDTFYFDILIKYDR